MVIALATIVLYMATFLKMVQVCNEAGRECIVKECIYQNLSVVYDVISDSKRIHPVQNCSIGAVKSCYYGTETNSLEEHCRSLKFESAIIGILVFVIVAVCIILFKKPREVEDAPLPAIVNHNKYDVL